MSRLVGALLAAVLAAAPALAEGTAIVASGQRPFQIAADAAHARLEDAKVVDARALRNDPRSLLEVQVVVSVGPLASGSVADALSADGRVIAILTPRTMGLPPNRTLVIPLDPDPQDVLGVIKRAFPEAQRVGVLVGRNGPSQSTLTRAAKGLGLRVEVADPSAELSQTLDELLPAVEVLWIDRSAGVNADPDALRLLFARADDAAIPVVGAKKAHVLAGATFALVPDPARQGTAAGNIARRLLAGEDVVEVRSPKGAVLWNAPAASRHGAKLSSAFEGRTTTVR